MTRHTSLKSLLRSVRRRERAIVCALALAWTVIVAMLSWRFAGGWAALAVVALAGSALVFYATWRVRSLDTAWLTRTLDAASAQLEDSSALLDSDERSNQGLQELQARRVRSIFSQMEQPDLRRAWPWRWLALSYVLAAASLLVPLVKDLPMRENASFAATRVVGSTDRRSADPHIADVQLSVRPPAYTGLPVRNVTTIGTRAPTGSTLRWSLRVEPSVESLALATHEGKLLPFSLRNGAWHGGTTLTRSILVRAVATGARLDPRLHKVEAIADRAPRVRMLRPTRTLSMATPRQQAFALQFQADDDYGVAQAKLVVTLAQGSGENIGVRTRTMPVAVSGPLRNRRFAATLDLAALGMQPGDDLIAQLHVDDNRRPQPHTTRSASAILRWPLPPSEDQSSMDGLVQRVLPAYFRSQRQIIIDSEALLARRSELAAEAFVAQSDAIGVDQRVLRLRYGQFLGEEGAEAPQLPAGASTDSAASDPEQGASSLFADAHAHEQAKGAGTTASADPAPPPTPEHPHEDAPQLPVAAFGDAVPVTDQYGHTHDIPEAATLLDPATQKLLRAALGEMWQAELHLRQGFPQRALPFENRALDLIKKVQQADRIYLAKAGSQIPPVDEARRLSGKRDGLGMRKDLVKAAPAQDQAVAALWSSLGTPGKRHDVVPALLLDAEAWLTSRQAPSTQVLDAIAALDAVRLDPACEPCRGKLRASLWVLMPQAVAGVRRRDSGDAEQRAYIDALARERPR